MLPYWQSVNGWDVTPGREFYVTVRRDDGATAYLLGPYELHSQALAQVSRGSELAYEVDPWSWFCGFGTASMPKGTNRRTVFGHGEPKPPVKYTATPLAPKTLR